MTSKTERKPGFPKEQLENADIENDHTNNG